MEIHQIYFLKACYLSYSEIFGDFWDIVSTQLQEIYHTVQVILGYFITKFLLHLSEGKKLICNFGDQR